MPGIGAEEVIQILIVAVMVYTAILATWIAPSKKRWKELRDELGDMKKEIALLAEFREDNKTHRKDVYKQIKELREEIHEVDLKQATLAGKIQS